MGEGGRAVSGNGSETLRNSCLRALDCLGKSSNHGAVPQKPNISQMTAAVAVLVP